MPGEFIDEVRIYQCGTHSDGSAIMCSEIGYAKIPFTLPEDAPEPSEPSGYGDRSTADAKSVGWQEVGSTDIHLSLQGLTAALKAYDITLSYDEADLERHLGPRPTSE